MSEEREVMYGLSIHKFNKKPVIIVSKKIGLKINSKLVNVLNSKESVELKELKRDYDFKIKFGESQEQIDDYLNQGTEKSKGYLTNLAKRLYIENRLPE